MGPVSWQEGFGEELAGRTIEEQVRCYAWCELSRPEEQNFRQLEPWCRGHSYWRRDVGPVEQTKVILRDGLVVGICIPCILWDEAAREWVMGDLYVLPYRSYCYDSDSDNNGSGYNTRDYYKKLVCLPFGHTLF